LQLSGGQENDVGQVSASSPDDSGLDLAVDVFCGGIAGTEPVGGKNANLGGAFKLTAASNTLPRVSLNTRET
jgi:hypothetical protein